MTLMQIDRDGAVTRLSAEAGAALQVGDTARSRELHAEAGRILERREKTARQQSEKSLILFLAATQYYKGGDYQRALKLTRKVQQKLLPRQAQPLFLPFFEDVQDRAGGRYEARLRSELTYWWQQRDYKRVIALLQEHPYVLTPGAMAYLRAVGCEHLADYRAAILFFSDAVRFQPDQKGLIVTAAALPLVLQKEDRLAEAWDYARRLLDVLPHPATYAIASVIRFHQASITEVDTEQRRLIEEQIAFCREAVERFHQIGKSSANDPDILDYVTLCLAGAALSRWRQGRIEEAQMIAGEAIELAPTESHPRVIRGFITYPVPGALDDFREAVRLGDKHYAPYYYLAHDAVNRNDDADVLRSCEAALFRNPNPQVELQLREWQKTAQARLAAPTAAVPSFDRSLRQVDGGFLVRRQLELISPESNNHIGQIIEAPKRRPERSASRYAATA
jgi:tetratricopeptide (TPR) repeat protein